MVTPTRRRGHAHPSLCIGAAWTHVRATSLAARRSPLAARRRWGAAVRTHAASPHVACRRECSRAARIASVRSATSVGIQRGDVRSFQPRGSPVAKRLLSVSALVDAGGAGAVDPCARPRRFFAARRRGTRRRSAQRGSPSPERSRTARAEVAANPQSLQSIRAVADPATARRASASETADLVRASATSDAACARPRAVPRAAAQRRAMQARPTPSSVPRLRRCDP